MQVPDRQQFVSYHKLIAKAVDNTAELLPMSFGLLR